MSKCDSHFGCSMGGFPLQFCLDLLDELLPVFVDFACGGPCDRRLADGLARDAAGRHTVNVVPWPGKLSTPIEPPCDSMML